RHTSLSRDWSSDVCSSDLGARMAMGDALERAGIQAGEVGYLNLHGTATPANDAVEAAAVAAMFDEGLYASSTKGWTGHTLGAAEIGSASCRESRAGPRGAG